MTYLGGVMTPNFGEGTGFDIGNIGGKCLLGARRTLKVNLQAIRVGSECKTDLQRSIFIQL